MTLEPCRGCGRQILTHPIANMVVRCDPSPLDGQGVAAELSAGRQIWTPEFGPGLIPRRLRGARPGDAKLLREHSCPAADALRVPGGADAPKGRETGVQRFLADLPTPSSAPSTERSGAPAAARLRSDAPCCDACSQPMADGTYASIQVGSLTVWAEHVIGCGGKA